MNKILLILAIGAVGVAAPGFMRPAMAQNAGPDVMTLEGLGSTIGVTVRDLDEREAETSQGGVRIDQVREGTPAARAGLKSGDVVVEFDGERIRSVRQFTRVVRESRPGRAVRAVVLRGSSRETVTVTPEGRTAVDLGPEISRRVERGLERLERDFAFEFDFDLPRDRLEIRWRGRLGASLTPLTPQLAEYFGVKEGLLVSSVQPESAAAEAGLRAGDVITTVGGTSVRTPADVTRALRRAEPGTRTELRVMRDKKEVTLTFQTPDNRTRPAPRPTTGRSV